MAKKNKKTRKKPQKKVPLLTTLGLAAGFGESIEFLMKGDIYAAVNAATNNFVGYDMRTKTFAISRAQKGLLPLALGIGGSMAATKLGANRRLQLPFVKL
jgi:hypothetical protein